jgi:prepilin-type N-terminal cleavage/methylation domain-containing protein
MRGTSSHRGSSPACPGRRGFTMIEMVAAMALLMVAMTLVVELVGWVAAERRAAERRTRAIQEAANLMERLTARAPGVLTPEGVAALRLSPAAQAALPGGELKVRLDPAEDGLTRIRLELRWRDRSGGFEAPVRLTSWVAPQRRTRP